MHFIQCLLAGILIVNASGIISAGEQETISKEQSVLEIGKKILSFFSTRYQQGTINISLYSSDGRVSMGEWDNFLEELKSIGQKQYLEAQLRRNDDNWGGGGRWDYLKIEEAKGFTGEGLYEIKKNFQLGVRVNYLSTNKGKSDYFNQFGDYYPSGEKYTTFSISQYREVESWLTSILSGVKCSLSVWRIRFTGSAFVGLGQVKVKVKSESEIMEASQETITEKIQDADTQYGIALEYGTEIEFLIHKNLSLIIARSDERLTNITTQIGGEKRDTDFSGSVSKSKVRLNFRF